MGLECEDGLVIVAGVDEFEGEFLREGDILKRVVGVEHILCFDLPVDELFLEVSGGLPSLGQVKVHFA